MSQKKVGNIARIPDKYSDYFYDLLCDNVRMVWRRDRRSVSSKPGEGLKRAAQAARTLDQAFGSLTKADREWAENLLNQEPSWCQEQLIGRSAPGHLVPPYEPAPLEGLSVTVFLLARLFSTAAGEVPPLMAGVAKLPFKPGRKKGS